MSSYTSSFKAVIAALAVIAAIEAGYSMTAAPAPVERSGYLNLNFNTKEFVHKSLIQEKLINAVRDQPDVIQIGDSSGLHGIIPRIVDQYLGGLKYENLSCCANTGFEGYYAITEFMLRHALSIKAVVLYTSLNNAARDPANLDAISVGGPERLRSAFGTLAPLTTPPTLAARAGIVRSAYTLGGTLDQPGLQPLGMTWPEFPQFLRDARGWRPEGDIHRTADKQSHVFDTLCGPSGVRALPGPRPEDRARDIAGVPRSYTEIELRRLADLIARHKAKLILVFQPYPCAAVVGPLLPALKSDIEAVMQDHPNLLVPDPALFQPWPSQWFASADHLRTGYEDAASRRAGRLIAKSLGLRPVEPNPLPAPKAPVAVWASSGFGAPPWRADGLSLAPQPDGPQPDRGGVVATETATAGFHHLEAALPDLPAGRYIASLTFGDGAQRLLFLQFLPTLYPGDAGNFHCSAPAGQVTRSMSILDAGLETLPGHKLRCWGKFILSRPGARFIVGFSKTEGARAYPGDEGARLRLYGFELSRVDEPD
jgi:hypothetical protein